MSISINQTRLRGDLSSLASIGRSDDGSRCDRALHSAAWEAARDWLGRRLDAAGVAWRVDELGNFIAGDIGKASIVVAGDLACGAVLDGALGLIAALECYRRLHESDERPPTIAFVDLVDPTNLTIPSDLVHVGLEQGSLLKDAGRSIGISVFGAPELDLRRLYENAEANGIATIPLPSGSVDFAERLESHKSGIYIVVSADADRWPPISATWDAADAATQFLLSLALL